MEAALLRPGVTALALLGLAGCASAPSTDPLTLPAGEWRLDENHAFVSWRARHMGLSYVIGRFDEMDATLVFDPQRPERSELTAVVQAASISTGDPDFDETLRGWIGARAHPEIVFRSDRIEVTGAAAGRVHGALTLNGLTRPAVLETEFYGGLRNPLELRQAVGFGADLSIDRAEFDIEGLGARFVGEEISLRIEAEFLRARDAPDGQEGN